MYFPRMHTLVNLGISLRPKQWTKNLLVFAALLFSQKLMEGPLLLRTLACFALFCLASGSVYLVNDTVDRKNDRAHPLKADRPIASGRLGLVVALLAAIVLLFVALAGASAIGRPFFMVVLAYFVVQLVYTTVLKNVVILDVLVLASGFVLRVMAGAVAIEVEVSAWLLVCTTLIALFLVLCKRRHELTSLADRAHSHRRVLAEYSALLLDQLITIVAAATVIAYCLYTMSESTVAKFGTTDLVFTLPFVIYGVFRYLYLVHRRDEGGRPEHTLISDVPLLVTVLVWALTCGIIVYR